MLPLYDAKLDTKAYNIFQPIETILPYDLPKLSVEQVAIVTKPVKSSPFSKPTVDTYCKACKKKFANEPTFTNHLASAKHIANEKKLQPAKATAQKIAVNPQVQEALSQLEAAQDPAMDPSQSVTIYWNVAQLLFALKRPHYVEQALELLICTLQSSTKPTQFSPAQITSFIYNSRLALARLLCIYQHLEKSRSVYLDALSGKWKLETPELLSIAKNTPVLPISALLDTCDTLATKYLTRERNRTKAAPPLADVNNSVTTIVNEAANVFAQENDLYHAIPSEHIAIVLYLTCSLVCPYEQVPGFLKEDFIYLATQAYESLGDLMHREVELKLMDTLNTWNVLNALLLAIEIDDLVRAKPVCALLKEQAEIYPDVKIVCDLFETKISLNTCDLYQDLDYIQLLLNETNESLLIRNRSKNEQNYLLDRIRDII